MKPHESEVILDPALLNIRELKWALLWAGVFNFPIATTTESDLEAHIAELVKNGSLAVTARITDTQNVFGPSLHFSSNGREMEIVVPWASIRLMLHSTNPEFRKVIGFPAAKP